MLIDLPGEILSNIVEGLVREYLFDYFTSHGQPWPWNAISALSSVSVTFRIVVHALLSSALSIPSLNGRLSRDPLLAMSLARDEADMRFREACIREEDEDDDEDSDDTLTSESSSTENYDDDPPSTVWWKNSPLLRLYSVIRESRLRTDWITRQEGHQLRRLADLPKRLVMPMELVRTSSDTRLVRPALVEGAHMIACTSFVGQLAATAMFFELVHAVLEEEPEAVTMWYDNIDKAILNMEALENDCMTPLRWMQINGPRFVNSTHIYASRIIPALNNFMSTPIVASNPMCARWRLSVNIILRAWGPLYDQGHVELSNQFNIPEALPELQEDMTEDMIIDFN